MIGVLSDSNARIFFNIRMLGRLVSLSLVFAIVSVITPKAETKNVKIMMDWIIKGTHAPFFVAQDKGYFKAEGVIVDTIDAGKGATNVAVAVAGGVYQFGWVDLPSMIRFIAANPASPLLAVYMSFDQSPLAVITRKSAGIRKPIDLDGKKIAGGPGPARAGFRTRRFVRDQVLGFRRRHVWPRLGHHQKICRRKPSNRARSGQR